MGVSSLRREFPDLVGPDCKSHILCASGANNAGTALEILLTVDHIKGVRSRHSGFNIVSTLRSIITVLWISRITVAVSQDEPIFYSHFLLLGEFVEGLKFSVEKLSCECV